MDRNEKVRCLKAMLLQVAPEHDLESLERAPATTSGAGGGFEAMRQPQVFEEQAEKAHRGVNVAEEWVTDPRIPDGQQLPDRFYTQDGGAFDKGHLVRRDDVRWGNSFDDIQKANGDTFHTTNCSPQVGGFNRSTLGEDNWGDLEELVQKQTKAEKAIIFSGPVLADDDPAFKGKDKHGPVSIQIPRKFWKIIITAGDEGPEAFGFVLEQDLIDVPLEFAVLARWKRYLTSIEDIEELLNGLAEFPLNLKKYDQYEMAHEGPLAAYKRDTSVEV